MISVNGQDVKSPPATIKEPAQIQAPHAPDASAEPRQPAIAELRQERWEAAKSGMKNEAIDLLAESFGIGSSHLAHQALDQLKDKPPETTNNVVRDLELRESFEGGGVVAQAVAIGASGVPAGEIAEGAQLLTRHMRLGSKGQVPRVTSVIHKSGSGEFSIIDWSGYPASARSPGRGPFRLLPKPEYDPANALKKATNRALRKKHNEYFETTYTDVHEPHPVKFGGSPTDMANKEILWRPDHWDVTDWWNDLQRWVEGK